MAFETATYIKSGRHTPYWIVLAYPLYGLFGFITRICVLGVFAYRRLVAYIARTVYFDDYRQASAFTKLLTLIFVALVFESVLLLSNAFAYGEISLQGALLP